MSPLEAASPDDPHFDFCLWEYAPPAPAAGKLRAINLLTNSFRSQGISQRADDMLTAIRAAIGNMRTVWGVKQANGVFSWELYFYDYARRNRTRSITRLLDAVKPWADCEARPRVNESCDYFMFSLDFAEAQLERAEPLREVQIYMGNIGSAVSSGICYALTAEEMRMKNFYFFFDAKRQMRDIVGKLESSVFLDSSRIKPDDILWPELRDCQTIVVANKPTHDGVYFSRITIDQLLHFMQRTGYPQDQIAFARAHRDSFDHLLFDVGIDYRMEDGELKILKSAYYGVF